MPSTVPGPARDYIGVLIKATEASFNGMSPGGFVILEGKDVCNELQILDTASKETEDTKSGGLGL